MNRRILKSTIAALLLILIVELFKREGVLNGFYSGRIYPFIEKGLHFISSIIPFSLYDLFIPAMVVLLIYFIVRLFIKGKRIDGLCGLIISLSALYASFYLLWGINYFSPGVAERNDIHKAEFDAVAFDGFLENYTRELNHSWYMASHIADTNQLKLTGYDDYASLNKAVVAGYDSLHTLLGMPLKPRSIKVKKMMFGRIYAMMGILGYYGPFFAEAHINGNLLRHQIPFTYTHEAAHLMGVTKEAEANFCAYLITTGSQDPMIRFSGYYSLLPYVLSNARMVLSDDEFGRLAGRISPEVKTIYRNSRQHWNDMYSETIGSVQDWFYEFYLKGNNIPSGMRNYYEVIGLVMAYENGKKIN